MQIQKTTTLAGVGLCVVALALAACSSSSKKSATSTNSPSTTGTAPANSWKVMVIMPTGTSSANWPESIAAVKAAARGINQRGGIKGRQVQVLYCNEKNQPGQGAICAQQAVSDGVLAVISSFNTTGGVMAPLEKAGIPDIGAFGISATGDDAKSPNSFPLGTTPVENMACPSVLKALGSQNTTTLGLNFPAAVKFVALVAQGAKVAGLPFAGKGILVDPAATDYAPVIQQLQQSGADSAVLATTSQATTAVLSTGGTKFRYCHSQASIADGDLRKLGPSAGSYIAVGTFPPIAEANNNPLTAQMTKELDAEYSAGDQDAAPDARQVFGTTNAWLSMYVLDKVSNQVTGTLSAQSLLAQLHQTTALDTQGLLPPIDFTHPATQVPDLSSIYVSTMRAAKWDPATGQFVSIPNVNLSLNNYLGPKG